MEPLLYLVISNGERRDETEGLEGTGGQEEHFMVQTGLYRERGERGGGGEGGKRRMRRLEGWKDV